MVLANKSVRWPLSRFLQECYLLWHGSRLPPGSSSFGETDMNGHVIKDHKSIYPIPVQFKAGDMLSIGAENDEYPGWIWVKTRDRIQGWAPIDYLELDSDGAMGIAKFDYCARELDIEVGEKLQIKKTLCGWHFAANRHGEEGWVPAACIRFT